MLSKFLFDIRLVISIRASRPLPPPLYPPLFLSPAALPPGNATARNPFQIVKDKLYFIIIIGFT